MADQVLKVGAEFDVGPIIAGTKQAGDAFKQLGNDIAQQAAKYAVAGLTWQENVSALQNLGYSANEARNAVQQLGFPVEDATVKITAMERAMANATARAAAMAGGMGGLGFAMGRVASTSSALAPLLAAAFPVVAAVAFVDAIEHLPDLINKATDALAGWDKEAKKAYQEEISFNERLFTLQLDLADKQERQNLIGLEGEKKKLVTMKDNEDQIRRLQTAYDNANAQIQTTTATIDKLKTLQGEALLGDPVSYARIGAQIDAFKTSLEGAKKESESLEMELRKLRAEQSAAPKDLGVLKAEDARKNAEAKIEAEKQYQLTLVSYEESEYKRRYAAQEISLDMEISLLQDAARRKIAIEDDAYTKLRALKQSEGAATGKDVAPELQKMDEGVTQARVKSNEEIIALGQQLVTATMRQAEETAKIRIDAERRIEADDLRIAAEAHALREEAQAKAQERARINAEADVSLATTTANRALEASDRIDRERLDHHQISLNAFRTQEMAALDAWYNAQVTAIQKAETALTLAGQRETAAYAALKNKETELDQQYANRLAQINQLIAQKQQQEIAKITTEINSGLNAWLQGHEKFGRAMAQVWDKMVVSIVDDIAKMGENFLLTIVTQGLAAEKSVLISAKQAAATAWSTAPNPIIGAVEAAATFAAVVGTYTPSFEYGGVVPGAIGTAVPIIAHAGERVLPQAITQALDNSRTSNSSSASTTVNMENHFHKQGDMSEANIARMLSRGVRRGTIPMRRR